MAEEQNLHRGEDIRYVNSLTSLGNKSGKSISFSSLPELRHDDVLWLARTVADLKSIRMEDQLLRLVFPYTSYCTSYLNNYSYTG